MNFFAIECVMIATTSLFVYLFELVLKLLAVDKQKFKFASEKELNFDDDSKAAWLTDGIKIQQSFAGLDKELLAYYELHKRRTKKLREQRIELLKNIKQNVHLQAGDRQRVSFNCIPSDPIDSLMNWYDYDLCLIIKEDDDLLRAQTHRMGENVEAQKGNINAASGPTNRGFLLQLNNSNDLTLKERAKVVSESGNKEESRKYSKLHWEHKEVELEAWPTRLLRAKWITLDQFELDHVRSSWAFYYAQLHLELPMLYVVLVRLLESAHLLEGSEGVAGGSSGQTEEVEKRDFVGLCQLIEMLKEPLAEPNRVTQLANERSLPARTERRGGDVEKDWEKKRLSRYALLLMLVGYLNTSKELRGAREYSPARQLLGFLSTFCPKPPDDSVNTMDGHQQPSDSCFLLAPHLVEPRKESNFKLTLIAGSTARKLVSPDARQTKLLVLDPIVEHGVEREGKKRSPVIRELIGVLFARRNVAAGEETTRNEELTLDGLTNLTMELEANNLNQIQALFQHLVSHLMLALETDEPEAINGGGAEKKSPPPPSPLSALFDLSINFGRIHQSEWSEEKEKEEKKKINPPNEEESAKYQERKLARGGASVLGGESESRLFSFFTRQRLVRRRIFSGKFGRQTKKISKSLLYLAMFLLIRHLLVTYLQNWRSELRERAREDLILLKQIFLDSEGQKFDQLKWFMDTNELESKSEKARKELRRQQDNLGVSSTGSSSEKPIKVSDKVVVGRGGDKMTPSSERADYNPKSGLPDLGGVAENGGHSGGSSEKLMDQIIGGIKGGMDLDGEHLDTIEDELMRLLLSSEPLDLGALERFLEKSDTR